MAGNVLKRSGKGRPKGALNKVTRGAKLAVLAAFEGIGGQATFNKWAKQNQTEFYKLFGRLIPTETALTAGEDSEGRPMAARVVFEIVPRDKDEHENH